MKCEGHTTSVTKEETAVIKIDAKPDAVKDPKVEEILKSFGFIKVKDRQYQDDKKEEKSMSYEITVSNAEKAKSLIKNFSQKLPKLIDNVDRKVIDKAIDSNDPPVIIIIVVIYARSVIIRPRPILQLKLKITENA